MLVTARWHEPNSRVGLWGRTVSQRERIRWALSVGAPGHCTAIVSVQEQPRYHGLRRVLEWFGNDPEYRVRRVPGATVHALRQLAVSAAASTDAMGYSDPASARHMHPVAAASVSHLMALQWMVREGCESVAVFEDDTSLDLLPYWERSLAELARSLRPPHRLALQLELKLDAFFLQNGQSGDMHLEELPLNCSTRYWMPHRHRITWGAGAYLMSRTGAEQALQAYGDGHRIDISRVVAFYEAPDAGMLFHPGDTYVLWPPYAMEWTSSSSVAWSSGDQNWHKNVHHASAVAAVAANVRRAAACALQQGE
eukprot:ctg_366.g221